MIKVTTGVKGLDDMLGGGLSLGRCTLICGGPGSGKTTFCVQFLYNGATKYGETGLYVSLGESPTQLKENMTGYGWDIERLEKDGKLLIVDASYVRTKRDPNLLSLIENIRERVKENQVKRVVIDPITSLILQYPDASDRQNIIQGLMEAVTNLGITSLMTTELRVNTLERQVQAIEFLSDGVIIFHRFTDHGRTLRAVQIEKMRGVAHDDELRPYKIMKNGIEVFSKEKMVSGP